MVQNAFTEIWLAPLELLSFHWRVWCSICYLHGSVIRLIDRAAVRWTKFYTLLKTMGLLSYAENSPMPSSKMRLGMRASHILPAPVQWNCTSPIGAGPFSPSELGVELTPNYYCPKHELAMEKLIGYLVHPDADSRFSPKMYSLGLCIFQL